MTTTRLRRLLATAAAAVTGAALATTAVAPAPAGAAIPTSTTTVLLVHGFNASAAVGGHIDCRDATMTDWAQGLRDRGFVVRTVGWYADDTNCDLRVPGIADNTVDTSIDQVAREFTNLIANRFGSIPVAISAHSMGGLVVRRALDGVENRHQGFSTGIRVTDVITSGTPHGGASITGFCSNIAVTYTQCLQAKPGSGFLSTLAHNPQTTGGTDWTLVGATCDPIVSGTSALAMTNGSGVRPSVFKATIGAPLGSTLLCPTVAATTHDDLVRSSTGLDLIATGLRTAS